MNIADEKQFLYGMMKDITEERRRLTDMYFSLKERVDHLHKLEEKGIGELSTKGFIDLFNDRETQIQITNLNRETQYAIQRREERREEKELQKPRYDQVAATLERGQADREAERLAKLERAKAEADEQELVNAALFESEQVAMQLTAENEAKKGADFPKYIVPKELVEETKDRENAARKQPGRPKKEPTSKRTRTRSGLTTQRATELVSIILKEHGAPLKFKEIYNRLVAISGADITMKNFTNNIFRRVMESEPRIERATTGYYQFNTRG